MIYHYSRLERGTDRFLSSLKAKTDSIEFPFCSKLAFEVQADGPVRVLIIEPLQTKNSAESSVEELENAKAQPKRIVNLKVKASLRGIGLSIIDNRPQELMYITLQTLVAKYEVSNVDQNVELAIGTGQVRLFFHLALFIRH